MKSKWTKLAAAGALSLCTAVPALAGSVTQPGETVGLNAGAPLPQGWYAINTVDWGCMEHNPAAHMYGSHHSGCRLVNAVDDFGRESTVAGGVAWGGSRGATQPTLRSRHLLLTVCTTRRRSANWPGTSAMDGGLATRLELISSTIARWRGPTPRSISGLR